MTAIPPTIVALRQSWQDFGSVWKAATGFLLFITALDWALLSPLRDQQRHWIRKVLQPATRASEGSQCDTSFAER